MPLDNLNSPLGFKLYRESKPGSRRTYRTASASRAKDLMVGDAYKDAGDGTVIRAALDNDTILGIVEGFIVRAIAGAPQGPLSQDYLPAADEGQVVGIEDREAEFIVQMDDSTGEAIGSTIGLVDADGSQLFRQSRQYTHTAGTQFTITEIPLKADNQVGLYGKVVVRFT